MSNTSAAELLANADYTIQKSLIERDLAIKAMLTSNDATTILKAQNYLKSLQTEKDSNTRSLLLDPQSFSGTGYKLKRQSLSYAILQNMAKVPVINSIISTRKEQIADFCAPQKDKYSTGFVIKPKVSNNNQEAKILTKQQEKEIEVLTEFILNCGDVDKEWHGDDFDLFTRKFIQDCFQYDQGTFEIIRDRKGEPREFIATDGSSYRTSEMYNQEEDPKYKKKLVNGYLPHYVQIYQERIYAEFLPW